MFAPGFLQRFRSSRPSQLLRSPPADSNLRDSGKYLVSVARDGGIYGSIPPPTDHHGDYAATKADHVGLPLRKLNASFDVEHAS